MGLCRAEGRIEEARALVFHVVLTGYHSSNSFINILLAVAAVWPQVLIHHSQRGIHVYVWVVCVLVCVCVHIVACIYIYVCVCVCVCV